MAERIREIGDLAEPSQKGLLKTEMLIPLGNISESNRYFGEVIISLELTWNDKKQNTPSQIFIDVKGDSSLKSDLESSISLLSLSEMFSDLEGNSPLMTRMLIRLASRKYKF